MKFLAMTRVKDTFTVLPIEIKVQLMEGVTAFINKYRQADTCKGIYSIANIKGSVSIWDVESSEKMAEIVRENPFAPFQDIELYVISDNDTHMKAQIELLKRLQTK